MFFIFCFRKHEKYAFRVYDFLSSNRCSNKRHSLGCPKSFSRNSHDIFFLFIQHTVHLLKTKIFHKYFETSAIEIQYKECFFKQWYEQNFKKSPMPALPSAHDLTQRNALGRNFDVPNQQLTDNGLSPTITTPGYTYIWLSENTSLHQIGIFSPTLPTAQSLLGLFDCFSQNFASPQKLTL